MPSQLAVQYPDLQSTYGQNSLYGAYMGMQREDAAKAAASQNLSGAQQQQRFEAEKQPYEVQGLEATNRHTNALAGNVEAMTPGTQASSNMKVREDQVDASIPMEQKRNQALSHIAANISDDQYKDAENHIYMGLNSKDPAIRQQAQAQLPNLRAIAQERLKLKQEGDNQLAVSKQQGANSMAVENAGIKAGKYAQHNIDFLRMKAFTGNYQSQAGAWMMTAQDEASKAAQATTPEEKDYYTKRASAAARAADAARLADRDARMAPSYNQLLQKPELKQFNIDPIVSQSAAGFQAPDAAAVVNGGSQAPQGDTVTIYKDGQAASIPRGALEKAKAAGWAEQQGGTSIPTK